MFSAWDVGWRRAIVGINGENDCRSLVSTVEIANEYDNICAVWYGPGIHSLVEIIRPTSFPHQRFSPETG